jgi:hypothetical protein
VRSAGSGGSSRSSSTRVGSTTAGRASTAPGASGSSAWASAGASETQAGIATNAATSVGVGLTACLPRTDAQGASLATNTSMLPEDEVSAPLPKSMVFENCPTTNAFAWLSEAMPNARWEAVSP